MGTRKGIGPMLFLYLLQIELKSVAGSLRFLVIGVKSQTFGLLGSNDRHNNSVAALPALHGLAAQPMALDLNDRLRINPATIDHDGKETEHPSVVATNDGYGLTGLHALTYFHKILGIEGVDGLQAVVMAHHDDIAILLTPLGVSHVAIEHCFHGIALRRRYLQRLSSLHLGMAYGQGKGIFAVTENTEVDGEALLRSKSPGVVTLMTDCSMAVKLRRCAERGATAQKAAKKAESNITVSFIYLSIIPV